VQVKCPLCGCLIEVTEGEGGLVCPGCGELLGYAASGGAFTVYTLPEDEDSYEFVAREWEKAVDAGEYERAERLRREMDRMMGETSEEEEVEVVEGEEEGEETDEVLSKGDYGETGEDEEDFGEDEDFGDEEDEELGEEEES
jgi:hypothetical protein